MRLLVLFDLPMNTEKEKKIYSTFRKYIMQDGFMMLQYSIYTRFCHNITDCEKHIKRVLKHAPKIGNVRILKITEIQYQNMLLAAGTISANEKIDMTKKLITIE